MKHAWPWLWNATQAISLALLAATIAAWIYFAIHPWSGSLQFVHYGPRSYINSADSAGHWRWMRDQETELGDQNCAWGFSLDGRWLNVQPLNSFYGWRIGWWQFVLLLATPSILRLIPWRAAIGSGALSEAGWRSLIKGPLPRSFSHRAEFKNIAVSLSLAGYGMAVVMSIVILILDENSWQVGTINLTDAAIFVGAFVLAPLTVPAIILQGLQGPGLDPTAVAFCAAYVALAIGIYFWRTNRLLHPKRNLAILH